jgi:ATP-dependent helicase HrpB
VRSGLPVDAALGELARALREARAAVLEAPPGAGKSTVVPLALLEEPWMQGRLLMLEPRRLAARAVAQRLAHGLNERPGETVGYRMRLDTRVSRATRLEVLTEGVLTRMLQEDPALEGVSAVIFDEFHERSLQADLGLALTLDARAHLNPQLRVLVMSATMDAAAVTRLIGDAPLIRVAQRSFPVRTHYLPGGAALLPGEGRGGDSPERRVAQLIGRALREQSGDVLAFLPGAREIRRVQAMLVASPGAPHAEVLPLFGDLDDAAQRAALAPAPAGTRKVVLATNIAETSLTLEGVRAVVDSGLVRRACFDPATGMGRLETQRISRASAEQRQGRAGRTQPGVCYRAWGEGAHGMLAAHTPPEILDADLAPLALELAAWGAPDAAALRWLDAPPAAQLARARELLARLGALAGDGRISAHGRALTRLPLHPRLAHLLLKARELQRVRLGARLAALLSERDLLAASPERDADIRTRLELLAGEGAAPGGARAALERARRAARELERQMGAERTGEERVAENHCGLLLACAYPDRIGRRRPGGEGRYALSGGRGAAFATPQALAGAEFIVAVEVDDVERDARILLAAPVARAELERHFADELREEERVEWDAREQAISARRTLRLGALVLEDSALTPVPEAAARTALLEGVRALGLQALPWDEETRALRARVAFVRTQASEPESWPDFSDAALGATLAEWLGPYLAGVTRRAQLARVPLAQALRARLTHAQQRELDELAPSHLALPTGTRVRIDYEGEGAPRAAARLQEVYGLAATPRIGRARVPVTLVLLSPAQRPLQVTRDLGSFWRGAYAEVRKDMRGRYPRHDWPEDPLHAAPTRGARRRR